jgi:DNA-binding MarR family transcriptional regulator
MLPWMPRLHRPAAHALKRVQHRHHTALNAALGQLGLSLVQWDALRHLHENPGASLHALAGLTFQTDQSFGALAQRMIRGGLIERIDGPGRAIRHRLTARGEELRRAGEDLVDEVVERSFAALSTREVETLHDLLGRILEAPISPRPRPTGTPSRRR